MNLRTNYNNFLEEIAKEPTKPEIKLILADKLEEDGYEHLAKVIRWFAKKGKWPKIKKDRWTSYYCLGYGFDDKKASNCLEYPDIVLLELLLGRPERRYVGECGTEYQYHDTNVLYILAEFADTFKEIERLLGELS